MSAPLTEAAPEQGRNIRRFLIAHVAAVVAIFGLAVAAGGGFAGVPMPPDEAVRLAAAPQALAAPDAGAAGLPSRREADGFEPASHDVAAPWATALREGR